MILGLRDRSFCVGDCLRGLIDQLLCLAHVQHRRYAALLPELDEPQRIFAGRERAFADLEFAVEFEQAEIPGRDVAHHDRHDRLAVFLRSPQLCARGFGLLTQASPDVYLKIEKIEKDATETARFDRSAVTRRWLFFDSCVVVRSAPPSNCGN